MPRKVSARGPRDARTGFLALLLLIAPAIASAVEVDLAGKFHLEWTNTLSAGASLRTEGRNPNLIGKTSLPQNRGLCAPDDCIGVRPDDTGPNRRFLAAKGALSSNTDDGDLNYDRGDLTALTGKWASRMNVTWEQSKLELGWIGFYDPLNEGFHERHPNRIVDPGPQPGVLVRPSRNARVEDDIGRDLELREANVATRIALPWDRELELRVGRQRFPWGVAAIQVQGTLDAINPLDANALAQPGLELYELHKPVGLISARTEIVPFTTLEAFYEFEWRPFELPAKGSLISFFDAGNQPTPDETVVLPFAKTPEDPGLIERPANPLLALVSATSLSMRRAPNREPPGIGQYGLALRHFVPNLGMQGTEFVLYFANYHSRLPSVSAFATKASCTRREGNAAHRDDANAADFLLDCGIPGVSRPGVDFEALPLDTARYFLEYPEDVHMFGGSFSSTLGGLLFEGEVAYRPNQPVQVDLEDVLFAAFQPAFPRHQIDLGVATLADSRRAIPDFLTGYRGGTPGEVAPGQYIRGYERLDVVQSTLALTGFFGLSNPLGGDTSAVLFELSTIWMPNRPPTSKLPLEGPGTNTHASPGIAETGDGLRINPIQNRDGYVTDFSAGYRLAALTTYRDVWTRGLEIRPAVVVSHDVYGVGPGLGENHLEGRKIIVLDLTARYVPWTFTVAHTFFMGGGSSYALRDRDFLTFALYYDF